MRTLTNPVSNAVEEMDGKVDEVADIMLRVWCNVSENKRNQNTEKENTKREKEK
jgi:hypothetical protein